VIAALIGKGGVPITQSGGAMTTSLWKVPLDAVWAALARADCGPHGPAHDFRARCPVHGGDNPEALHVSTGADGRALVHCHAHGCSVDAIVSALDLTIPDLFPAGHRHARRRRLHEARRNDFTGPAAYAANTLIALDELGHSWSLSIQTDCPHCGAPRCLLVARSRTADSDGSLFVSCPGDEYAAVLGYGACTVQQFLEALAGMIEVRRAA